MKLLVGMLAAFVGGLCLAADGGYYGTRYVQPNDYYRSENFRLIKLVNLNQTVIAIKLDGTVEFGPGYTTTDEASKLFWLHVASMAPCGYDGGRP